MQLLPGFGGGNPATSAIGGALSGVRPATPPPSRTDPAIAAARKKQRGIELRRKGRRASILTSGRGLAERTPVNRPQAKAELLGQVGG